MASCVQCEAEVGTMQTDALLNPNGKGWLCTNCWREAPKGKR